MERFHCRDFASFYSKLCRLRDGGLAGDEAKNEILSFWYLDIHSRAIVGSAKGGLVVDIWHEILLIPRFVILLDSWLRWVNAIQASLNDWSAGGRGRRLAYSIWNFCFDGRRRDFHEEEPSEASIPSYAVVVSAVVLLSLVYQYLTGNVDPGGSKASIPSYAVVVSAVVLLSLVYQYLTGNVDPGGSKAYSRSSLDFRDIYVAVVLFLGAYVWIKFRDVALRGVHKRVVKRGRITKVVYDARLTPPRCNGEAVSKLDLGQFKTEQEAHNKFLIAAFYYNRDEGLLDGWFQVPSMSEEERSLTGLELRAWVIGQAKKVYEDFKKKEAVALLHLELLEDELMPEQDEVNVDISWASLLNSVEHQQPAFVSQVENLGMDMAMLVNHGWDCASHSFGGMHEGLALSNGHCLRLEEGSALPASQLPPNTESGMSLSGSVQWDLLQTRVSTQQQQIYLQQQQISDQQQQISLQQRQIQELGAQMLQFRNQQRIQEQHLEESRIQTPQ